MKKEPESIEMWKNRTINPWNAINNLIDMLKTGFQYPFEVWLKQKKGKKTTFV